MTRYQLQQHSLYEGDTIDLSDDAQVVGSETRGPHRAVLLVLEPLEGTYVCGVETTDSGECSREVDSPEETCYQH